MRALAAMGGRKGLRPSRHICSTIHSAKPRFIKGVFIEAGGRQLWLAMNPRSGPSAHAEGYT